MGAPHRVGHNDREVTGLASFFALYAALAIFFGWYARVEIRRYPVGAASAAGIYVCFLLIAGLYLAPGFASLRAFLKQRVAAWLAVAVFLLPYLIYAAGTGDFRWRALAKLASIVAVPIAVFALAPVANPQRINWQDIFVLTWMYVPVQFHLTSGIWNVPVNLDFMARLFIVAAGAWAFLIVRGVKDAGYDYGVSGAILRDALVSFVGFSVIAIPLGFGLRFIAWNPQVRGVPQLLADYVTIFLFVAVAEELFFRGLLQNLLEGTLGSGDAARNGAQAIVSVLFGFSHIQHAPAPNWRYVALATVAGMVLRLGVPQAPQSDGVGRDARAGRYAVADLLDALSGYYAYARA